MDHWTEQDLRHRRLHYRVAGSIEALFGVGGVTFLVLSETPGILEVAVAVLGVVEITLGVAFALGRRWPRFLLWPLSVLHLLVFPIGTLLAGYILWVLYDTRNEPAAERAA